MAAAQVSSDRFFPRKLGSVFAACGSPLLIQKPIYLRNNVNSSKSISIRCEQNSKEGNGLDVWLGRLAVVGFAAAISVEIGTGKGLVELLISAPPATQARNLNESDKVWSQSICKGTENVAELHFYVQDVLEGPNKTVYEVARASITSNSPTTFGQVRVLDDLLTAEPDKNSEKVGRIQGLITSADLETTGLAMNLNFVFTSGEYKGSTIAMLGRNQIGDAERELALVGGTGVFRGARGYAITSTYSYDVETSYGVLEYTLYVTYVDGSSGLRHQASK